MGIPHFRYTHSICNFILLLICTGALFIDLDLSDADNIVPIENTIRLINLKRSKWKKAEHTDQINHSGIFKLYNVFSVK